MEIDIKLDNIEKKKTRNDKDYLKIVFLKLVYFVYLEQLIQLILQNKGRWCRVQLEEIDGYKRITKILEFKEIKQEGKNDSSDSDATLKSVSFSYALRAAEITAGIIGPKLTTKEDAANFSNELYEDIFKDSKRIYRFIKSLDQEEKNDKK